MPDQSPPQPPHDEAPSEEENGRTHPFGWPALIIIALLIIGGWFLITRLGDDTKMQDCIQSGRRNCAPIDDTGR